MNVTVEQLAKLIAKDLSEYSEEVERKVEDIITETSKEALKAIRQSPAISHLKGYAYERGFFIRDVYKSRGKQKGYFRLVVANRECRIAHLLEHGHAKRNGGRTRAFPHWINGQKVADTLPDRIKKAVEK